MSASQSRAQFLLVIGPRSLAATDETRRQQVVLIRRAKQRDAAAIESLLCESFREYKRAYTVEAFDITTPGKHEIEKRIKSWKVWVAVHAHVIVGTVSAHAEGAALHIRSMAVHPSMRGHGIGKLLLARVEHFARDNGYKRLVLSTTPFLIPAIRLYEDSGFQFIGAKRDWFGTQLRSMAKQLTSLPELADNNTA
jgi:GNAT superfamily N-acetyltransferase